MKTWIRLAFLNIRKNWRQSLSAIISISAGFVSLVVFQSYMNHVDFLYIDSYRHRFMYGDIIVEREGLGSSEGLAEPWKYYLDLEDQNFIQRFIKNHSLEVFQSARFLNFIGLVTNGKSSSMASGYGYDYKEGASIRGETWDWNTLYGKPLHRAEGEDIVLLGHNLGKRLGCKTEPIVKAFRTDLGGYFPLERPFECPNNNDLQFNVTTESGQFNAFDFKIIGFTDVGYKEMDNKFFAIPLEKAQMLLNTRGVSFLSILLNEDRDVSQFMEEFKKEAQRNHKDLSIQTFRTHRVGDLYRRTSEFLSIFRNFVILVILVIACLSIFNTMVKNVNERTREIGTLRSIGFLEKQVLLIFVSESFFLSLAGCLIGMALTGTVTWILNSADLTYKAGLLSEPVPFHLISSLTLYSVATFLLSFLTLVTGYFATRKVVYKKIVDCLTYA